MAKKPTTMTVWPDSDNFPREGIDYPVGDFVEMQSAWIAYYSRGYEYYAAHVSELADPSAGRKAARKLREQYKKDKNEAQRWTKSTAKLQIRAEYGYSPLSGLVDVDVSAGDVGIAASQGSSAFTDVGQSEKFPVKQLGIAAVVAAVGYRILSRRK